MSLSQAPGGSESTPLHDRALVVMGGTTGIGLSAAMAFAATGARVVVVGRNPDNAAAAGQALGARGRAIVGDASDPETAPRAIQESANQFGGFHGLYHVAGGNGRRQGDGPLHQITDTGWEYTLQENLTSLFLSNRAAVQWWMERSESGAVLNMGSVLGSSPSPRYFSTHAYAAAKAAVIGLTRASAAYYAPYNIRFNVIAPGLVATPMARRAAEDAAIMEFVQTKQPLDGGRIGRPEDLDAAAIYFLSDASRFVTGQVLTVDGGWSVSEGQYD